MAKAFSENEKEIIRQRLKEGAVDCLQRFGVRKTTVDELVKIAGISKGAFYLFYPVKEVLFFEVLADFQLKVQNQLLDAVQSQPGQLSVERVTQLLFELMKTVNDSFVMTLFQNGDLEYLQRKLPEEVLASHRLDDDQIFGELCRLLPLRISQADVELFSASLRAIAMTLTAQKAIGEAYYDQVLRLLIRGVVEQLYTNTQP